MRSLRRGGYAEEARRILVLQGCHLDSAAALRRLGTVFQGYEDLEEGPPALYVLAGPFFEEPRRAAPELRRGFAALAALLSVLPNTRVRSPLPLPTAVLPIGGCAATLPFAPKFRFHRRFAVVPPNALRPMSMLPTGHP